MRIESELPPAISQDNDPTLAVPDKRNDLIAPLGDVAIVNAVNAQTAASSGNGLTEPVSTTTLTPKHRAKSESSSDIDLTRLYLNQIRRFDLLTQDQEIELAKKIENGNEARLKISDTLAPPEHSQLELLNKEILEGEKAFADFYHANLRLVVSIAKKYKIKNLDLMDLVQYGNMGLQRAIQKFDWRKGFKFSTYATNWIMQSIQRGIANDSRTIRVPVHVNDKIYTIEKVRKQLQQDTGREPTAIELAKSMNMTLEKLHSFLISSKQPLSLDDTANSGENSSELWEFVVDDNAENPQSMYDQTEIRNLLEEALSNLNERERLVIEMRFGLDGSLPKTLEEVGQILHVTRERIRQIEATCLAKLRHPSNNKGLRDFLR